ncbi:unnamed protein product [Pseudo-nitzschia multistriata]|uniref:Uncharacterized protein n=1 Tax=Pseudo-nitzschia multistriata TaxID=183589 RepID=A0A448Z0K9_9STRA|nr:unnamed protein product [Pseudo-nitzschia multistriata]
MSNVCKFCDQTFGSRNALFRHLRSSRNCFEQVTKLQDGTNNGVKNVLDFFEKLDKRRVAIQFGYCGSEQCNDDCDTENIPDKATERTNEIAATIVCKTFFLALKDEYPSTPVIRQDGDKREPIFTLASGAILRHPSLVQESNCSALADVVGISYEWGASKGTRDDTESLVHRMQIRIDELIAERRNTGSLSCISVLGIESLAASSNFHAEKDCTQRAYQYLVPVHWIDKSTDTREWIHSKLRVTTDGQQEVQDRGTPSSLIKFKKTLKLAESRDVTQISSSSAAVVSSPGRYGLLWKKERRSFHNFCDPSLGSGSMASPSNENVWRTIDRCRLHSFVIDEMNSNEPFVVIEIRGDGFVAQQVRRIVATLVAISNDWLPVGFLDSATRADITIETPIAPAELMYFSSARFHFLDLILPSSLFETKFAYDRGSSWRTSLHSKVLRRWGKKVEEDARWISKLINNTSPRIRSELKEQTKAASSQLVETEDSQHKSIDEVIPRAIAPEPYRKVLSLLHNICDNEKWPRTPDAKSRFIRSPYRILYGENQKHNTCSNRRSRPISSEFQGQLFQIGSFTVVNPKIFGGKSVGINAEFPELVEAVFDLETYCLSRSTEIFYDKKPVACPLGRSSHCMISRNAEFTPHFLNGQGGEESCTMIVGLGDYIDGDFIIDGKHFDIRYQPLQYNGWRQIQSTGCFRGERFSLVWFTPKTRIDSMSNKNMSFEDSLAKALTKKHDLLLPSYPQLRFRLKSTDSLVINEILDSESGCTYELSEKAWSSMVGNKNGKKGARSGFFVIGHESVLDIGAHIGVFSRYTLSVGCKKIIAYEPELENAKLLEHNLKPISCDESESKWNEGGHIIRNFAVAHGEPGQCNFVNARNRSDGTLNSWRHSLEKYSSYVDRKGANLVSRQQNAVLDRSRVQTIPFFGDAGALEPGITFVKMDCEGAEIDILLAAEASRSADWLDVTHLVFEWSFTKERRVAKFHKAVANLTVAGFEVVYQGQGSWWDTEPNSMWPYHNDLVVFARKRNDTCS